MIPSSAPGAAGSYTEADVDANRAAITSATEETNGVLTPSQMVPSGQTSIFSWTNPQSGIHQPNLFDFSDLELICTINADDIANRWLNNFVPMPGQKAKNYTPSISTFIHRILESYANSSIRGCKVPPFVHWSQVTLPSSHPLSTCFSVIHECNKPDVGATEVAADRIKVEMARLLGQHTTDDDMTLLAAFQAHLIYAMVIFFKFGRSYDSFLSEAMMNTQELACAVAKKGLMCVSEEDDIRPRWECWIAAEAKRRTLFTMCLFDSALLTHDGLPTHLATELRGLLAPACKALWETRVRQDWEGRYDLQEAEWPESWLQIDELWPMPEDFGEIEVFQRRTRVDAWLEDLDEFGTMIYAVTSVWLHMIPASM
ncbi:hypothetical protein CORC01_06424 [Colletotrichum orchidophilum]|uniref:Transcription factor domain-containing protein n=1 Tax=Colletotrichum orchidophilum TaxID=1209926 RepID=A0A1G4B9Z4_9PEZI|nr:uncharacterized protein CORC01_06424 [Colletotrichum orchidophilum]OHE98227.1 hypothetical protein CORC01_06424 [Colletotrichum orchidophilum]